jgi:2-methylfumaryl-CoA isomerase
LNDILKGLRIVEGAAFVAAPLCGMTLAQQGADVIRFDPLEGGLDARRWPVTERGRSLYWAGLNKGKRSLAVDTRSPEGRELIVALITAPGAGNGIFLTNFPTSGWLGYEALRQRRDDLIMMNVTGNPDGSSAVDYTVNCALGFPFVTGPAHGAAPVNPVNHVLPAWDAIAGVTAAMGILAAERHRRLTGAGQLIKLPLADVAFAMTGNLGYIAEVQVNGTGRRSSGNHLYGAYGCEFETADDRYVYVVAITRRQWDELGKATGLADKLAALGSLLGVDLAREGDRFQAREAISAVLAPWFRQRTLDAIGQVFKATGVCWGPYQTFAQMVADDPRCSTANPLFAMIDQPGIGSYLVPGSPLQFAAVPREVPRRAPVLGEHTDEILADLLGLAAGEIGRLRDARVVAGPIERE